SRKFLLGRERGQPRAPPGVGAARKRSRAFAGGERYSVRIFAESIWSTLLVFPVGLPDASIFLRLSRPSTISPKIVCLSSRCGVSTKVRKNWPPSVPGPALAIESRPGFECRALGENSPANL